MSIQIKENILLAPCTTFGIGGPARYFVEVKSEEEITEACKFAGQNNLAVFVLGGGSNILVSDNGFGGLVIKIENCKLKIVNLQIIADAGASLAKLVSESVEAGLSGLEWAVGIPGTVGGAVCGNTGAYGHSISELIKKVKTISAGNLTTKEYFKNDCGFEYRGSCFRKINEIITEVELELLPGKKEDSLRKIKDTMAQRKIKIPLFPSPGSFFRNYKVCKNIDDDPLIKKIPEFTQKIRGGKIGAGYLIEQCGLKGKKIGGAVVANEHANFIVNTGNATAEDVISLAAFIKEKISSRYGFNLEEEVCMVGF